MLASVGVDALNPKGTHIPLLVSTVSIEVLKFFLHSLPCYSNTVLGSPSETFCQLQYLLLVHLYRCELLQTPFSKLLVGLLGFLKMFQLYKCNFQFSPSYLTYLSLLHPLTSVVGTLCLTRQNKHQLEFFKFLPEAISYLRHIIKTF